MPHKFPKSVVLLNLFRCLNTVVRITRLGMNIAGQLASKLENRVQQLNYAQQIEDTIYSNVLYRSEVELV